MKVFKFGGASVKDALAIKNMFDIVKGEQDQCLIVVVSAMGKTTNALEKLLQTAHTAGYYEKDLAPIKDYHLAIILELFPSDHEVFAWFEDQINQLHLACDNVVGLDYDDVYDLVIPFGELISTGILARYFNHKNLSTTYLDARELVVTNSHFREASVHWDETKQSITNRISSNATGCFITQGFIGADTNKHSTTLGREGSDFTGAIFAHCLGAESLTIWKDVPGILNGDPKRVKQTVKYDRISYSEAAEMTYYGASVIHPKTIRPLAVLNIPLLVKPFLQPHEIGTTIGKEAQDILPSTFIFKDDQTLLSFGMKDFSFISEENLSVIFSALAKLHIKINMMQNSAISLSVCFDGNPPKREQLIGLMKNDFQIRYNDHLQLITIKHYTPALLEEIMKNRDVLLEQRTRHTFQLVARPI